MANCLVLGLLKAPYGDYRKGQAAIAMLRRGKSLPIAANVSGLTVEKLEQYIVRGDAKK
jgi:hypothetical protein